MSAIQKPAESNLQPGPSIKKLRLEQVGPVKLIDYEPAERLNIITGDNSLGKSFLLDCLYWALTGSWVSWPALPRRDPELAQLHYHLLYAGPDSDFYEPFQSDGYVACWADYNPEQQRWVYPAQSRPPWTQSLVIYARFDGSFALWDPRHGRYSESRILSRTDVFDGLQFEGPEGRKQRYCNGLIWDWFTWQISGERYGPQFRSLVACLSKLSPSEDEPLVPGEPTRIPNDRDDRTDYPTLHMPYGDVPVVHASAAVQRILALAYMLVWAWHEHLADVKMKLLPPSQNVVILMDEVEAHLHPRWQRGIVPALVEVAKHLSKDSQAPLSVEFHLTTHSPMVLASVETVFDEAKDKLHHLKLAGKNVVLEELKFVKRGPADRWLMSDVFGLAQARSLEAEKAIKDATALQLSDTPNAAKIRSVHNRLVRFLAPDDEFWPRWTYFAEKHGVQV